MIVLGIDPGMTGALALYWRDAADTPSILNVWDVPTLALKKGPKTKNYVDLMGLARLLDNITSPPPVVFIEQVSAMPNQGVSSTFDFGRTTGILQGVCAAHFLRIEQVPPAVWKRALKVPAAKDGARARASQIFPRHTHLWARVKDDGRAEAALIAYYGAQVLGAPQ